MRLFYHIYFKTNHSYDTLLYYLNRNVPKKVLTMNKNLCVIANGIVPLDINLLSGNVDLNSDLINLTSFIPKDIIQLYEKNLPTFKDDFCELNDTKAVNINSTEVLNKYIKDTNYLLIEVEITFSVSTRKIISINLPIKQNHTRDIVLLN